MSFAADGLPDGLELEATTGLITGTLHAEGAHYIYLSATNPFGTAERTLRLQVGREIGLTPPRGWNSWNCFAEEVSQEKVLSVAKAMVSTGLADYGWEYINIDGCWQSDERGGPRGAIQPAPDRFSDMGELCRQIHDLGLKVGLYSTPWVTDYGGNIGGSGHTPDGSDWKRPIDGADWGAQWGKLIRDHYIGPYRYDYQDAAQWGEWGIDYLKYDWSPIDLDSIFRMWRALDLSGRDIIFSLSNNCPRSIAADVGVYANAWRTTGDLHDEWQTTGRPGTGDVQGLLNVWQQHHWWQPYTRPGHFADPDMLVLGDIRWAGELGNRLSPVEQETHFTLWCLFAAPLLIGCSLDRIDAKTMSLLTNGSALEVQQDPLGLQAKPILHTADEEVLLKPLEDGRMAVGLFNKSGTERTVASTFAALGLGDCAEFENVWSSAGLRMGSGAIEADLAPHGSAMAILTPSPS